MCLRNSRLGRADDVALGQKGILLEKSRVANEGHSTTEQRRRQKKPKRRGMGRCGSTMTDFPFDGCVIRATRRKTLTTFDTLNQHPPRPWEPEEWPAVFSMPTGTEGPPFRGAPSSKRLGIESIENGPSGFYLRFIIGQKRKLVCLQVRVSIRSSNQLLVGHRIRQVSISIE